MNITNLKHAKSEALRFVKSINALELAKPTQYGESLWASKHTGAVKRASMDLTRVLSDLRRPG